MPRDKTEMGTGTEGMTSDNQTIRFFDRICFGFSSLILTTAAVVGILRHGTDLHLPVFPCSVVLPVLTAAAVGYLTNWFAILLLFRPYRPVKFLFNLQGVVPKKQAVLAKKMGEEIPDALLSPDVLALQIRKKVRGYLNDPELTAAIQKIVSADLELRRAALRQKVGRILVSAVKSAVDSLVTADQVRALYRDRGAAFIRRNFVANQSFRRTLLTILRDNSFKISKSLVSSLDQNISFLPSAAFEKLRPYVKQQIVEFAESERADHLLQEKLTDLQKWTENYLYSPGINSDVADLKSWMESHVVEDIPEFLLDRVQELIESEDARRFVNDNVIPAVRSFLMIQIRRNKQALVNSLELPRKIEDAILRQKPEDIYDLVNRVSGEHLLMLQLLGFILGGFAGLLLVFAQ